MRGSTSNKSDSGVKRLTIDLGERGTARDRAMDSLRLAVRALVGLPEFEQDAHRLLSKYEEPGALLELYERYRHWGDNIRKFPDEIADRERVPTERVRLLADLSEAVQELQTSWGMDGWEEATQISIAALNGVHRGCASVARAAFMPLKQVRFELILLFVDQALSEVETAVLGAVMPEVREQYRAQGGAEPLGPAPGPETAIRNLEWYFLHKRGRSYRQTMLRWNRMHPESPALDPKSDRDLNRVKQGIYVIAARYRG